MSRLIEDIIGDLQMFDAMRDGWPKLESLVDELKASPKPERAVHALFAVFERYPGATTGGGVLMTVLHTLEALAGFELCLVESLRRRPSILAVMLANRLLNSGINVVGTDSLLALLEVAKLGAQRIVREEIESVLGGRA